MDRTRYKRYSTVVQQFKGKRLHQLNGKTSPNDTTIGGTIRIQESASCIRIFIFMVLAMTSAYNNLLGDATRCNSLIDSSPTYLQSNILECGKVLIYFLTDFQELVMKFQIFFVNGMQSYSIVNPGSDLKSCISKILKCFMK